VTLLGPPGAGKGTQAARLCDELELAYVATGDMLRGHRSRGTDLGLAASEHMRAGRLVPDELVIAMITEALPDNADTGLVIDGFPRRYARLGQLLRVDGASSADEILTEIRQALPGEKEQAHATSSHR
jgi:adenylate kinase